MKFYHATKVKNLRSILSRGLRPSMGFPGFGAAEYEDLAGKVYLGRSKEEAWSNLENARGLTVEELEGIGVDTEGLKLPHALLEINLPEDFPIDLTSEGEFYTSLVIPPGFIRVLVVERKGAKLGTIEDIERR